MNKTLSKVVLAFVFSLASLSAQSAYNFTLLPSLSSGRIFSDAYSINASNQVVGFSEVRVGGNSTIQATLWSGGSVIGLGAPYISGLVNDPGTSYATSINSSGQIVGVYSDSRYPTGPMVWSGSEATGFGNMSVANSINNSGQIAGVNYNGSGGVVVSNAADVLTTATYTRLPGTYTVANSINDIGQVVGSARFPGSNNHAALWSNDTITDLGTLGGTMSTANSINNVGQIVGSAWLPGDVGTRATLWSNGTITDLGTLGGNYSAAWSINNIGQIVGGSYTASNINHAFLYDGTSLIDLNSYLDASLVESGWVLNFANDINDNGSIVGQASNSLQGISSQAFVLIPVPEADTSAMLLAGLGVIGFVTRRRKN